MTVFQISSKDLHSSFLETSSRWLSSQFHKRKSHLNLTNKLTYLLLLLMFFNIVNFQILHFSIQLEDIDVVNLLAKPPPQFNNNFTIPRKLESIFHGVYLRNEQEYLRAINQSTIITKPSIHWSDKTIELSLKEYVYKDYNSATNDPIEVHTSIVEKHPNSDLFLLLLETKSKLVHDFLSTVLECLYRDSNTTPRMIQMISDSIIISIVGRYGYLFNSSTLFILYIGLLCFKKRLPLHYVNLIFLLISNAINIGFVVSLLVVRINVRNKKRENNDAFIFALIAFEISCHLIYMFKFFIDHRLILQLDDPIILPPRQNADTYSTLSSVYPDITSRTADITLQELTSLSQEAKSAGEVKSIEQLILPPPSIRKIPYTTQSGIRSSHSQKDDKAKGASNDYESTPRRCTTAPILYRNSGLLLLGRLLGRFIPKQPMTGNDFSFIVKDNDSI